MITIFSHFTSVWLVDFEFCQPDGAHPQPICMAARELRSGHRIRLFGQDLLALRGKLPPFPTDAQSLLVAYYSSAEWSCFLTLDWPMPARILDLFAEFRCLTAGLPVPCGNGLLGALAYHGLDAITVNEKDEMRQLAIRGGPFTNEESQSLLDYCMSDVDSLARLLPVMAPKIDLQRALLRGRFMAAVARMERNGTPVDVLKFRLLKDHWAGIQDDLIRRMDTWGIYDGRSFRQERFAEFLKRQDIPWPRLKTGRLQLDDDTFRSMAKIYPAISSIRELRHALSDLRLNDLAVGLDGRNRCMLSAFGSKTGRNQPSNSRYIFGPAVWLRGLIKPPEGHAVGYVDWEQQEFGIAAALSGDKAMMSAYLTGDPYLAFAKQANAVPLIATKASHPKERDRFKVCALAVQYGMGEKSLALALNETPAAARELLRLHHRTYQTFWKWSNNSVSHAMLYGSLRTVFGWSVHVGVEANPRSLANFPMQANGAEMLRLACCEATESGILVCAPVHDAVLIEAPISGIEDSVAAMQGVMERASKIVLGGFPLRTEAVIVRYPNRYMDKRGERMWRIVMEILDEIEGVHSEPTPPVPEAGGNPPISGSPGRYHVCGSGNNREIHP